MGNTGERFIKKCAASAPPTIAHPQQQRFPYERPGMTDPKAEHERAEQNWLKL
jgi:hypothetical protein